jgi:hypothetical protein
VTRGVDRQQCIDAEALLFRTLAAVDPSTGQAIHRRVETASYRDYQERRAAFAAARATYTAAYKEAQKTPVGRRTWPQLAMTLQIPVTAAHDRLREADGERLEQAEALLERAAVKRRQGHP